jgi:hypothetical protein
MIRSSWKTSIHLWEKKTLTHEAPLEHEFGGMQDRKKMEIEVWHIFKILQELKTYIGIMMRSTLIAS